LWFNGKDEQGGCFHYRAWLRFGCGICLRRGEAAVICWSVMRSKVGGGTQSQPREVVAEAGRQLNVDVAEGYLAETGRAEYRGHLARAGNSAASIGRAAGKYRCRYRRGSEAPGKSL
jgi:hypothetical protein